MGLIVTTQVLGTSNPDCFSPTTHGQIIKPGTGFSLVVKKKAVLESRVRPWRLEEMPEALTPVSKKTPPDHPASLRQKTNVQRTPAQSTDRFADQQETTSPQPERAFLPIGTTLIKGIKKNTFQLFTFFKRDSVLEVLGKIFWSFL